MGFTKISLCEHHAHFLFRIEISDVFTNRIGEIDPAGSISFLNALGITKGIKVKIVSRRGYTIFTRYLNFGCPKPLGTCCRIIAIQYVVTHLQCLHNSVFPVICFQKANSYPSSGGLLMAVPPDKIAALQAALAQTPSPGEVIGEIIPAPEEQIQVIA
ncbi:MAG: hypothetical protein QF876_07340 [Desulfobacterales bacterium]|nr:hypothetical protein [Desulfobacterales bacterium]MDP6807760.1 hypothetical protein [Desulfobacterales bacterium]